MQNYSHLLKQLGIVGASLETSIRIGELYVRPNEIQKHLARYALRFVNCTDDEVYQFQHIGTAAGIKYRGRFFAISTEHQRVQGEVGKIGVVCDPGQSVVTPSRMWTIQCHDDLEREDDLDFTIFEFEPKKYEHRSLWSQFVPVFPKDSFSSEAESLALTLGYPTRLQNVDYFGGEVDLLVVSNFVKYEGATSTDGVLIFKTLSEDRYFEDGTSGSPVFMLGERNDEFAVKWLGIVVRGGKESRFGRVIDSDLICQHMDRTVFGAK